MQDFFQQLNTGDNLTFIAIRTIIIYFFAILLLRIGNPRFRLATPFDFVLPIILGSLLSRSINGSSPIVSTFLSCALLICLHRLVAYIAFESKLVGKIFKGQAKTLMSHGKLNLQAMHESKITLNDIMEACRQKAGTSDLHLIKEIRLERNGDLSFIKYS